MKKALLPLLASFTIVAYGYADEARNQTAKSIDSNITSVTVYADRAQVTREAGIRLPAGPSQLAFRKLPGWLDEGSVRVSLTPAGKGQILDVQIKRDYLARATDEEFKKAEAAVQDITDEIAALDDEKRVLDAQSKHVDSIRMFSLDKLPKDVATREISTEEYGQSVEFIANSLRRIAQAKRELNIQRRELQPELSARQRKLNELRQRAQLEECTVLVTLKGPADPATLRLTYMLPGATWEPVHELRATADADVISLSSYAVVMQTSGEDWTDVELALSTQSSTETMKIPELGALMVGGAKLPQLSTRLQDTFQIANQNWVAQNAYWNDLNNPTDLDFQREYRSNNAIQVRNAKRVQQVFETVKERGTTAQFSAVSKQTIRTDGRQVRVPIGRVDLGARNHILAAPEISLNAARTVELSNASEQPLLPGSISLFVGGAFLGLTETEYVAPGESFAVYLGVADEIKLSRTLDKKRSSLKRGGSKTKMQVSFLVTVENLSNQEIELQLTDRVPVSETDRVRVYSVKVSPTGKPDDKGLLNWPLELDARETQEFRIEYSLEYPTELPEDLDASDMIQGGAPALREQIQTLEMKF